MSEVLKPGEVALGPLTSSMDVEGSFYCGLPFVIHRFETDQATKDDLLYLVTPGVLDLIVYYDRSVVDEAHKPEIV